MTYLLATLTKASGTSAVASTNPAITTLAQLPTDKIYNANEAWTVTPAVTTGTVTTLEYRYEVDSGAGYVVEGSYLTAVPTNAPVTVATVGTRLETIIDRGLATEERGYSNIVTTTFDLASVNYIKEGYEVGATTSTTVTVNQTFAPAAVNTGTNVIDFGTDMNFNLHGSTIPSSLGMYGRFQNVGGGLPSELNTTDRFYILQTSGTEYEVYPETKQSDMGGNLEGTLPHEVPLPVQNYFQRENAIVFTDQGTGTHSFVTDELVGQVVGQVSGYKMESGESDYHSFLPLTGTTPSGAKALYTTYTKASQVNDGRYEKYGPIWRMNPNDGGTNLSVRQDVVGSKRTIAISAVIKPEKNEILGNKKVVILPSGVNTVNGVFTYVPEENSNNHALDTGDAVEVFNYNGNTLPNGLAVSTTYYLRDLGVNTFSLFDTEANALNTGNETGRVTPADQGVGNFTIFEKGTIADNIRIEYLQELLEAGAGGANAASIQVYRKPPASTSDGIYPSSSIGLGGNISSGSAPSWVEGEPDGITEVQVTVAPDGVNPTRSDTATDFVSGNYFLVRDGTSGGSVRLHDTYLQAAQHKDDLTSSLNDTQMVKFSNVGDTEIMIQYANRFISNANNEGGLGQGITRYKYDGLYHKWDWIIDYGDASGFITIYVYVDNVLVETVTTTSAATGTTAVATDDQIGTFFNSQQGHAPYAGYMAAIYWFSDATASASDVATEFISSGFNDYVMAEYGLTAPVPQAVTDFTGIVNGEDTIDYSWSRTDEFVQTATFTLTYTVNGGTAIQVTGIADSSYSLTGLTAEDEVTASIVGINVFGTSGASNSQTQTTEAAASGGGGFDASTIAGYFADFDSTVGVIETGNQVSTWEDQSGNNYHATAVTAPETNTRTINGVNVIDFDRSNNEYMEITAAGFKQIPNGPNTIFIVFQANGTSADQSLLSGQQSGGGWGIDSDWDASSLIRTANGGGLNLSTTPDTNTHIVAYRRDGANHQVWLDGALQTATDTDAVDVVLTGDTRIGRDLLGGSTALDGALGRIVVYNQAISNADMNSLGNGLAGDFGITWNDV